MRSMVGGAARRRPACFEGRRSPARPVIPAKAGIHRWQPIAASLVARVYEREIAAGRDPEIAPAHAGDQVRRMAYEAAEIPRILAGAYGGDADLTPYQLWMKYWIAPNARRPRRADAMSAARSGPGKAGRPGRGGQWYSRLGLNQRPSEPQSDALAN